MTCAFKPSGATGISSILNNARAIPSPSRLAVSFWSGIYYRLPRPPAFRARDKEAGSRHAQTHKKTKARAVLSNRPGSPPWAAEPGRERPRKMRPKHFGGIKGRVFPHPPRRYFILYRSAFPGWALVPSTGFPSIKMSRIVNFFRSSASFS